MSEGPSFTGVSRFEYIKANKGFYIVTRAEFITKLPTDEEIAKAKNAREPSGRYRFTGLFSESEYIASYLEGELQKYDVIAWQLRDREFDDGTADTAVVPVTLTSYTPGENYILFTPRAL